METTKSSALSPALVWTTAVAVIVFCAAGAAAFLGWLPNSNAAREEAVPLAAPAKLAASSPAHAPVSHPTAPRPSPTVAAAERPAPVRNEQVAQARCSECGVIESVRTVESKGAGSGLGAVGGAVAGGVLGHQVGGGRGQDVMTVVGAVGGALAGNEVEKRMKSSVNYAVTVRMEDGSRRTMNQASAPTWREGDRVKVVDGAIRSNG